MRSSSLAVEGTRTDRLLALLAAVGADHYISGPSARAYIEEDKLRAKGVSLEYMTYDYPEYEQLYPPYEPRVSIRNREGVEVARAKARCLLRRPFGQ